MLDHSSGTKLTIIYQYPNLQGVMLYPLCSSLPQPVVSFQAKLGRGLSSEIWKGVYDL